LMAFRGTVPSFGLTRGPRERPRATLQSTMGWMDSLSPIVVWAPDYRNPTKVHLGGFGEVDAAIA
jgi:hypothetical protein